jgi:two-component system alkaline phosphatase synthesis response regulator PhoP
VKVLIVDDEPHIRMLLEQTLDALEDEGVELFTASNGAEALSMIESERPELVLLDVMMPFVNGFEVCRKVRANQEYAGMRVMMLTAKGQDLDRQTGESVGADVYVTKPFDPDEVLEHAARLLGLVLG